MVIKYCAALKNYSDWDDVFVQVQDWSIHHKMYWKNVGHSPDWGLTGCVFFIYPVQTALRPMPKWWLSGKWHIWDSKIFWAVCLWKSPSTLLLTNHSKRYLKDLFTFLTVLIMIDCFQPEVCLKFEVCTLQMSFSRITYWSSNKQSSLH